MTHRAFLLLAALLMLTARPVSPSAETAPPLGSSMLEIDIELPNGDGSFTLADDRDIEDFFNVKSCECETVFQIRLRILAPTMVPEDANDGELWIGEACDSAEDNSTREQRCRKLETFTDIGNQLPRDVMASATDLMFTSGECVDVQGEQRGIYILFDDDSPDDETWRYSPANKFNIDTRPPNMPAGFTATGGEKAINLSWDAQDTDDQNIAFYQAFCSRTSTGEADRGDSTDSLEFAPGCPLSAPDDDMLTEQFLCGTQTGGTSMRITGLENDVEYNVALVAIDDAANVSAKASATATPVPTDDFWEHYRQQGGEANGGFCIASVTDTTGGATARLLLALLVLGLALRRRSRGEKRQVAWPVIGGIVLAAAAPVPAHAQAYDAYWNEFHDEEHSTIGPDTPNWNIGFRLGPYLPDVDGELSNGNKPFENFYGDDSSLLFAVDIERFLLSSFGQLGIAASVGITRDKAGAFTPGTTMRAGGDKSSFYLVPTSLGVVYRLTQLDDHFKVPIVPYGKAAFSYYMWGVRNTGGDWARVSNADGTGTTRATGASLGFQASLGIAIRAERIDPQAAVNLRNDMGIEHAGLYVELIYAKVDHFGASNRLNVGDVTWAAGINFEY